MNAIANPINPTGSHRFDFDEYGVNARYNTERQEAEWLRMQSVQLANYSGRYMELSLKIKDLKQAMKDLDKEFKEDGFNVPMAKKGIKDFMKKAKMTEEEIEEMAIVEEWLSSNEDFVRMVKEYHDYDENAKLAWKEEAPQRAEKRLEFLKEQVAVRRKIDEANGMEWIDHERERIAKLCHLGWEDGPAKLAEIDASIKVRDERRAQGLPPLPEHDKPTYPDQYLERAQKEREAKLAEELVKKQEEAHKWEGYEPEDIEFIVDTTWERLEKDLEYYEWENLGNEEPSKNIKAIKWEMRWRDGQALYLMREDMQEYQKKASAYLHRENIRGYVAPYTQAYDQDMNKERFLEAVEVVKAEQRRMRLAGEEYKKFKDSDYFSLVPKAPYVKTSKLVSREEMEQILSDFIEIETDECEDDIPERYRIENYLDDPWGVGRD